MPQDPPRPALYLVDQAKKSTFSQKVCEKVHFLPKSMQKSALSPKKYAKKVHFLPKSVQKSALSPKNNVKKSTFSQKAPPSQIQTRLQA